MTEPLNDELAKMLSGIIHKNSAPLAPQPVDVAPRLQRLSDIRAVLFDVYGTLFVSGSGDVGTTDVDSKPAAFGEALDAVGVDFSGDNREGVHLLSETIAAHHARDQEQGVEFPEVDIREVWRDVLVGLRQQGAVGDEVVIEDTTIVALEYEVLTNPVWPMPHAADMLRQIQAGSLTLGIVSNAQVFTRLLFSSLLEASLDEFGFEPDLCVWSYEHRQAKPGTFLYERARDELAKRGVSARQVLFVGNDMLKDVWPASRIGFRTALFAGDARSYRPRTDDGRVQGIDPDLVLTELAQLPECVLTSDS